MMRMRGRGGTHGRGEKLQITCRSPGAQVQGGACRGLSQNLAGGKKKQKGKVEQAAKLSLMPQSQESGGVGGGSGRRNWSGPGSRAPVGLRRVMIPSGRRHKIWQEGEEEEKGKGKVGQTAKLSLMPQSRESGGVGGERMRMICFQFRESNFGFISFCFCFLFLLFVFWLFSRSRLHPLKT